MDVETTGAVLNIGQLTDVFGCNLQQYLSCNPREWTGLVASLASGRGGVGWLTLSAGISSVRIPRELR